MKLRTEICPLDTTGRLTGIVLICLALLCCVDAIAAAGVAGSRQRNLQFVHLTTDSGLSQDMINDIVQDRRGYIWIATQEGLNRYDGYQIVHYEHLSNDPDTLSNDFVRALLVDRDGVLWAATQRGLNRYDEARDTFIREGFAGEVGESLADDEVRAMMQTHDGAYWFGTQRHGLVRVDRDAGIVQRFRHKEDDSASLPDDSVLSLLEDSIGNLWIGSESAGLSRYDSVTNRFVRYDAQSAAAQVVPGKEIRSIYEDRAGMLWIGTGAMGLSRFDLKRGSVEHFTYDHEDPDSIISDRIHDIIEDKRGTLWVATDEGLAEWDAVEGGFVSYRHNKDDRRSLVHDKVNKLYSDAAGVLWVGTWDGVSRWNYFSDTFSYYRAEDRSLSGNTVTSIAESSSGMLWMATYGQGLTGIDPISGEVRFYRHEPGVVSSLPSDNVMAVHVDSGDRLWVGTRESGFALLDEEADAFVRFEHDPDSSASLSNNQITSIHTDGDALWVGTFGGGLNLTSADQPGEFRHFRHLPGSATTISSDQVLNLYTDRSGNLWVGTAGAGLNRFNPETNNFRRFQDFELARNSVTTDETEPNAGTGEQLRLDRPLDLVEDRDGSLWIGTLNQGLWRWNARERNEDHALVDVFRRANGLPTNTIFGVLEEGSGALWLSSNRGLTRFDAKGGIRQFDSRNGLRDREFIQASRLRSRNGKLLFGSPSGVVGFYPGDLPLNERPPQLVVEARSRQERLVSAATGDPQPEIEVGYLDRFLAFDFVALDFMSPDKNQYRYKLEGFDDHWVEGDDVRRATYTNLTPGRYTFFVEGTNNDGLWNRDGTGISVRVIPGPWNTWWAYLIYSSLAALVVGLYLRSHRGKLKREAQERDVLEKKVNARTQELAERNVQLESLNGLLAEASVTDSLTELKNRRYLNQFVDAGGTSLARKLGAQSATVVDPNRVEIMFFMMIDLDDFKLINDRFGHQAGDQVLVQVKDVLEASSRTADVLIRWGGDEFMIIGIASSSAAVKLLAERIRAAIADLVYDAGNGAIGLLSASIGVATFALITEREHFGHWEQIVGIADRAAYIAKSNGRNAWVCLAGAEALNADQLSDFSESLEDLVVAELVKVDSSLSKPPDLRDSERQYPPRRVG